MKKIISVICLILFIIITPITFIGCTTIEESAATSLVSNTISNIFTSALTIAANILAADGTQQLAVSAAESYIASVVTDPIQLDAINQIIESAIPTLANDIASLANTTLTKDISKKSKIDFITKNYVQSNKFKNIVNDCVIKYNNK